MAQFYTLEEAARVLGMTPEELKTKAQHREIRAFLDGGSWRFRVVDVDEMARHRGLGSDAELRLSDLEVPAVSAEENLEDLDLSEFQLGAARPDLADETMDLSAFKSSGGKSAPSGGKPSTDTGSDHDILFDDLSVPPNPVTGSSSVIIGMQSSGKLPSDSDVRLASPDPDLKAPSDSDVTLVKDDTADHNFLTPAAGAGDTAVRATPVTGSSAEVAAAESDSDFELNPSSDLVDVLQPESGSDFELSALESSSDEFEATPLRASDSDVTAAPPDTSGINLSRPSDSGINLGPGSLEAKHHDSIELAPLSDEEIQAFKGAPQAKSPGAPQAKSKAAPGKAKPGLAATPPPSAKKGEKDIFDDTDFEVDVPLSDDSSDDKTMQLEAASDFDLEDSDSGSEVFAIDEEDVDQNAATAMAPSAYAEEEEEDDGFEEAVSSEMATAWASDEGAPAAAAPAMVISREAAPEWGGLWVGMLSFTAICLLFASFVSLDLMRNLYDFRETPVASGLVRALAGLFGS